MLICNYVYLVLVYIVCIFSLIYYRFDLFVYT